MYNEVKRKANAGERIKIVNVILDTRYNVGDEFEVDSIATYGVYVKYAKGTVGIHDNEYVVLEPIAPAAPTTANLPDLFAQFIRDNAPAVRSYLAEIDSVDNAEESVEPIPDVFEVKVPLTRAKVIEMARERVAELKRIGGDSNAALPEGAIFIRRNFEVAFHVNRDKRAVTALIRKVNSYGEAFGRVVAKATAKAAPDDVFNADIGKAIAAERALGLTLTDAFVNAPKPTEPVAGMKVRKTDGVSEGESRTLTRKVDGYSHEKYGYNCFVTDYGGWIGDKQYVIIDDTDADYAQEEGAKDGEAA